MRGQMFFALPIVSVSRPDDGVSGACAERGSRSAGVASGARRCRRSPLVAATGSFGLLDLLQDLVEVVARRILQRRVRLVGLEFLQPERLADGQHVPVVDVGGRRRAECAALTQSVFYCDPRHLERIALDVDDLGPVIGKRSGKKARRGFGHHREVDLPVLVAHRRRILAPE